jgi:hypothetical protein
MTAVRALRTGDVNPETATYVAACGCLVQQRVTRGNVLPRCLICEREVVWYRRETYPSVVTSAPMSVPGATPPAESHA